MITEDKIEEVLTDIETKFLEDLKTFDCKTTSEEKVSSMIKQLDKIKEKLYSISE